MQQIQFIDINVENESLKMEINSAIQKVISEGDFIQGKAVREFEKNLRTYLGVKHVIGVGNGTDALQISILALGLKPGDEVILPSFTYFASAEAIAFLGMTPVLVDIELDSFTISIDAIEKAITSKTKAIIPVHIYGQPVRMEPLLAVAKKHNIFVIEDAAQAIGGECLVNGKMKKVSTIGEVGCFSFYPAKNLGAFGDAGAVVTNDDNLAKRIKIIANHGQSRRYVHEVIGMNSRLDSIQAAVLNVKLNHLEKVNLKRNEIAGWYTSQLKSCKEIALQPVENGIEHVFHQYTVRVPKELRDQLIMHLKTLNIPVRLYYPIPVHNQIAMVGIGKVTGKLTNTELVQDTMISLPIHLNIGRVQVEYVTESIKSFFRSNKNGK